MIIIRGDPGSMVATPTTICRMCFQAVVPSSNPINSTAYGALMGGLLFRSSIFGGSKRNRMTPFWTSVTVTLEFVYGKIQTWFLQRKFGLIPTRRQIIFPAEGEGRNTVFTCSWKMVVKFSLGVKWNKQGNAIGIGKKGRYNSSGGWLARLPFCKSAFWCHHFDLCPFPLPSEMPFTASW